jgi:seryl-tRNA synthetase
MAKSTLVKSGYLRSFPDLVGVISTFGGSDRELPALLARVDAEEEWSDLLVSTDVAMCSAACHSLFPLFQGDTLGRDGTVYEIQGTCFRHEPSEDPARMQSFRQHEFVYLGTAEGALAHRTYWLERGTELLGALGLAVEVVVANDPFFGRAGRLLATGQLEKELKYEITSPISSAVAGAIASGNYHEDHFGVDFRILLEDGSPVHSACIGFGLERISLALVLAYGTHVDQWPGDVRHLLQLETGRLAP